MQTEDKKRVKRIFIFTVILAGVLFLMDQSEMSQNRNIVRNTYGKGRKVEHYQIAIGENPEQELTLNIEEKSYSKDEIYEIFEKVMSALDQEVLGENVSWDYVDHDLSLPGQLPSFPVKIEWDLGNESVMDSDGQLIQNEIPQEGKLVELKAMLSYENEQALYVRNARVYPKKLEVSERQWKNFQEWIAQREADTREESVFVLPDEWNGIPLKWGKRPLFRALYVLGIGGITALLTILQRKERQKEKLEQRKKQLEQDYPELISKLTLLLGTGMNVRRVWEQIIEDYEKHQESFGSRVLYEEMKKTSLEMQSKIPESEAYERFGRRCALSCYTKLGMLLSQNMRKGTKGLIELLEVEAIQALEQRKNLARRLGEEASTKLLLPMVFMLAIVLAMIVIPAFLTMN